MRRREETKVWKNKGRRRTRGGDERGEETGMEGEKGEETDVEKRPKREVF